MTSRSDDNPVRRLLGTYVRPYAGYVSASVLAMLLARVFWMSPPVVLGTAVDAVFTGTGTYSLPFVPQAMIPVDTVGQFWLSLGLIGGAFLSGSVVYLLGSFARVRAAFHVQHDLRVDAYTSTQALDIGFFDSRETGEVMSVLNNDVNQLESFLDGTLQIAGNAVFIFLVTTGYMLWLNPQLAAVALLSPVVSAVLNYWYSRTVEPEYESLRENVGDVNSRLQRNVAGMTVVKSYTREAHETDRVAELSRAYREVSLVVNRLKILVGQVTGLIGSVGYVLLFTVGGWWVLVGPPPLFSGELTAGTLVTFLVLHKQFAWPTQQLSNVVDQYQSAKASSRRVMELLDRTRRVPQSTAATTLEAVRGDVTFENVWFGYGEPDDEPDSREEPAAEPVLQNLSLDVTAGETVGIVGPTGAGKSTILKLLLRFYDVDGGRVAVDGHDVRDVTLRSLRDRIAYVGQNANLVGGTVAENVAYSDPDATREAVVTAAKRAGAHEFVTELADGYDTEIGEDGGKLSGGQRQRLSIARALLDDAEILLLDEATSNVDNETELLVRERLADVTADRTTFVVAHRLSTVRNADRILVVDDGEITERGTHEELLTAGGLYSDLWEVQVGDVSDAANLRQRVTD
jgi:ATP-binding cassette subfamily B protein